MNPLVAGLVSGAITAAAALGGVWLTLRKTVRLAELQRSDARREVARSLLVELIHEAREWSAEIDISSVYVRPEGPGAIALWDSETARLMGVHKNAMGRAFVEVMLRLGEDELSTAVRAADGAARDLSKSLVGPDLGAQLESADYAAARKAFGDAIDQVAEQARELLSEPLITQA